MKVWRFYGPRSLVFEEEKFPEPGPDELLLKVLRCGICQTDIDEFMAGAQIFSPLPIVPGHEFGGEVVKAGNKEFEHLVGKIGAALPLVSCGKCHYCQNGRENLCENLKFHGVFGLDGGFAEYAVIKIQNFLPLDDVEVLNFVEPLTVMLRALKKAEKFSCLGKKVLIVGAGPMGLVGALLFQSEGWEVSIVEEREKRREKAKSFGFRTYNSLLDVKETFPVVLDTAGEDPILPAAFSMLFDLTSPGGVVLLVGVYLKKSQIPLLNVLLKEKSLLPVIFYTKRDIENIQNYIYNLKNQLKKLITQEIDFENLVDAFVNLELFKDNFIKLVVTFQS